MRRRVFSRDFKVEAVKLIKERGVTFAQAARDLDVAESVLRRWAREGEADLSISVEYFPGSSVQKFPLYEAAFGCFLRCLKRKESFPVSRMSQWWVTRSRRAVVIFGSPKTPTHSAKERLVVKISEVFS